MSEVYTVGRLSASFRLSLVFCVVAFALTGAGPNQVERPPQPFFQDFISGIVTVEGEPAPAGTQLIACIDDCDNVFQSKPKTLAEGGEFELLEVNPSDENLIGNVISFYLVNEFGRIRAVETRTFVGIFDFYPIDLTFNAPLPTPPAPPTPTPTPIPTPTLTPTLTPEPTPTAVLPVTGDPTLTAIPRLALIVGAGAAVVGAGLLLAVRRAKEE